MDINDKIRCVIADDEPLAVKLLESYVERHPKLRLTSSFHKAKDALAFCLETQPDAIFLDINMPGINGIDLATNLPPEIKVVFVTAYNEFALDGFRVNALDYLLKPIDYQEFCRAADRLSEWAELKRQSEAGQIQSRTLQQLESIESSEFLTVRSEYRLIRIARKDIMYLEGLKDYVKIHLATSPMPVLTLTSLKALEEKLLDSGFMRVHRSYIVNIDKVKVFKKNAIDFGKRQIPVSESYRKDFIKRIGG